MRVLESTIRKNGFEYNLVERSEHTAIYSQHNGDDIIAYEVFKVKIAKEALVFGRVIEPHEKFPSDLSFGVSAWSYRHIEDALVKFNSLEELTTIK